MRRYILMLFIAPLLMTGCLTIANGGQPRNLLTSEDERKIGDKLSAEIEKKEKLLDDPKLQAYVSNVGRRLAATAERQDVDYQFKVIDAADTVNAFALPGGHMYIYTGLLKICANEAELASVMAHEIAHVSCYHHGEAITRICEIQAFSNLLLGGSESQLAQLAGGLAGKTYMNYFSKGNEYEADAYGMAYLFRAGYQPDAMISFMQKLGGENQQRGILAAYVVQLFSTHPPTQERVMHLIALEQRIPADRRANGQTYADRYKQEVLSRFH